MKYLQPNWPAPSKVKAYTTTRSAWTARDQGPPLKSVLNLPEEPIWLTQTHSTIVMEAAPDNMDKTGDASLTATPHRVCIALTADCLPVLITNKQGSQVAAIHAGWRGLSAGIIEETLNAMDQPMKDLLVWLGPAIGPQKFEVGMDVYEAFISRHAESAKAFIRHTEGKWLANLYELARIRLMTNGVTHIYGGDFCTYSQPDLFFSYRRDKGKLGNMANVIWIDA